MKYRFVILLSAIFFTCSFITHAKNSFSADVIIYGGTSAVVIAAVEVVHSGKTVIVVSPDKHLSGLSAGGLGFTDTNNHGPFSLDNIGENYDYPKASCERRAEIILQHFDNQAGQLWFLTNDPRVPEYISCKMKPWGLPKDELADNGNGPHQLYIREARRMIGEYVTTENDVLLKREVPASVGMGSYTLDSHNVQRYITPEGYVQNEGDVGVHLNDPYSISYKSITPKKEECTNLLVPVCVSSSHIAYGSIRMEPVFMILGPSSAVAACMAIDKNLAVQSVPYNELKTILEMKKQILTYNK